MAAPAAPASSTTTSATSGSANPNVRFKSRVLDTACAEPALARAHFESKLAFETDPSDVKFDMDNAPGSFVVVDCRSPESYAKGHVPGALNIPYRTMNNESTSRIPKGTPVITYCSSISCNASTKGAARMSSLGFKVKEMLGGMASWQGEGYSIATGPNP